MWMTKAEVNAGVCGFTTVISANADSSDPFLIHLSIDSDCEAVRGLAAELRQVSALDEITYRGDGPAALRCARRCLHHAACPVPCAVIKVVEVEAGLALPCDVSIHLARA